MLQVLPVGIKRGFVDKHVLSIARTLEADGLVVRGLNLSRSVIGPRIDPSNIRPYPPAPCCLWGAKPYLDFSLAWSGFTSPQPPLPGYVTGPRTRTRYAVLKLARRQIIPNLG